MFSRNLQITQTCDFVLIEQFIYKKKIHFCKLFQTAVMSELGTLSRTQIQ